MNKKSFVLALFLGFVFHIWSENVYICDFENPAQWPAWQTLQSRNAPNTQWFIGDAERTYGTTSLYVTKDNGLTADYEKNTYGIPAYVQLPLTAGNYRISFDWKADGNGGNDRLWVAAVPKGSDIPAAELGGLPSIISNNLLHPESFKGSAQQWKTEYLDITLASDSMLLCFYWEVTSVNGTTKPGACIDNVQVVPNEAPYKEPGDLFPENTDTGFSLSWTGSTQQYEVLVYDVKTGSTYYEVMFVDGNQLIMPYDILEESAFKFRVRPITDDTIPGLWTETRVVMVYDPESRCFDYMNFYLPNVKCTYGPFNQPDSAVGVVDNGYTEMSSRHTIHYMGEIDPRTLTGRNQLSTLPPGETLASVRLGGEWRVYGGNIAQSITYTIPITEGIGLIEFQYAVVAQSGGHDSNDQPRFTLEIYDANGTQLGECMRADFRPPRDDSDWQSQGGESSGWYKADVLLTNFKDVYWRDWTLVAFNVEEYVGSSIQIKITNRACALGEHWGYIYFTLGCADGKLQRSGCEDPNNQYLIAPDGFDYEWERPFDYDSLTGPWYDGQDVYARELYVAPNDTNTYTCYVMPKNNPRCYFTLTASGIRQLPKADAEYEHTPHDCINEVTFTSKSAVVGSYTNEEGVSVDTIIGPCDLAWMFGENGEFGVSSEISPKVEFPKEGGTFPVALVAIMPDSEDECSDVYEFNVTVPSIQESEHITKKQVCDGLEIAFEDSTYNITKDTTIQVVYEAFGGCDSIRTLEVTMIDPDTICMGDSYNFYGNTYTEAGTYTYRAKGTEADGCDSIDYELCLVVLDTLDMEIGIPINESCNATDRKILVPYTLLAGVATVFDVRFDDEAHAQGFTDMEGLPVQSAENVTFNISNNALPDRYMATFTFYNEYACGDKTFVVPLDVYYPAEVLTHRWDDVLAIRNENYNNPNGEGYKFTAFQWYKDGQPLEGETKSYLYLPNEKLDPNTDYQVALTREGSTESILSCPAVFTITENDKNVTVELQTSYSQQSSSGMPMHIYASQPVNGTATVYNMFGLAISSTKVTEGEYELPMPPTTGVYIVKTVLQDTNSNTYEQTERIIIQ